MSTLVVSDLHLGLRNGGDVARAATLRQPLLEAVAAADELVVLGDLVELREGPASIGLAKARPALGALGAAAEGKRITVVPGNHDHALLSRWLERSRGDRNGGALGLEQRLAPSAASDLAAEVAAALAPAEVELAYPGVWLRDDVYGMHGHYLDRHLTMPSFECLGIRLAERLGGPGAAAGRGTPDEYEQALAPVYAVLHALAQRTPPDRRARGAGTSHRVWQMLVGPDRPLRHRLLSGVAFPVAIGALNLAGLGPLTSRLSPAALRRSALNAMAQVASTLRVDAAHVLFGHTHRAGPRPGDDVAEWSASGGARLHNTGNWVFESIFIGDRGAASPYWPGSAITVAADGAPEHHALLAGVARDVLAATLRQPPARGAPTPRPA